MLQSSLILIVLRTAVNLLLMFVAQVKKITTLLTWLMTLSEDQLSPTR